MAGEEDVAPCYRRWFFSFCLSVSHYLFRSPIVGFTRSVPWKTLFLFFRDLFSYILNYSSYSVVLSFCGHSVCSIFILGRLLHCLVNEVSLPQGPKLEAYCSNLIRSTKPIYPPGHLVGATGNVGGRERTAQGLVFQSLSFVFILLC